MNHVSYYTRRIMDLQSFLGHFDNVRESGSTVDGTQYTAKCPAHETNHQSLAICLTRDGRYLVHCHAGCSAAEVMRAAGLSLGDLYPDGAISQRSQKTAGAKRVESEQTVLNVAAGMRSSGQTLSAKDKRREREAWIKTHAGTAK